MHATAPADAGPDELARLWRIAETAKADAQTAIALRNGPSILVWGGDPASTPVEQVHDAITLPTTVTFTTPLTEVDLLARAYAVAIASNQQIQMLIGYSEAEALGPMIRELAYRWAEDFFAGREAR